MKRYETADAKTQKAILAMKEYIDALQQDCQDYLDGKIKTQAEIARKHGVTRACISKRIQNMRPIDAKAIEDFCKSELRKTYGLRQMIVLAARSRLKDARIEANKLWSTTSYD